MHRIKRQAKRNAWYSEEGETNYNPFGKLWRPDSRTLGAALPRIAGGERDLEAGESGHIQRAQTEGDAQRLGSHDQRRQSKWEEADVIQAATSPARSRPARRSSQSDRGLVANDDSGEGSADANEPVTIDEKQREVDKGGAAELRNRDPKKHHMGGILGRLRHGSDEEEGGDEDEKEKAPPQKFTVWSQLRDTVFNSPINVLLLLVPVGIAFGNISSINKIAVFVINFIAIIPLAGLLSFATEELALRVGETLGGLLNATFGNAVELIVSILALFQGQYIIVQTSLVGSMLSNLLLVMGMCFFFGGLNKVEQHFNVTVAQTAASLLALAIGSLIIPTVWYSIVQVGAQGDTNENDGSLTLADKNARISEMSHGVSILLLIVYGCYLYFQLSTHASMYSEPSKKAERRKPKKAEKGDAMKNLIKGGQMGASTTAQDEQQECMRVKNDDDDEAEIPKLSITTAMITLVGSTVLVGICAEYMTAAIHFITQDGSVSPEFVGLILLPIVGNAAEHATAVTVAMKDKMDLAIGVAVGSSMQIALLVLPLVITIGWIADREQMTLAFDGFQVIVLFVAVLLVNYLIGDGKSHWLEGVLLQVLYMIIAIAAWYYPVAGDVAG